MLHTRTALRENSFIRLIFDSLFNTRDWMLMYIELVICSVKGDDDNGFYDCVNDS